MKSIILVVVALAAVAVAAPPEFFKILRSDYQQQPEGSYNYGFETENGIKREETGELKSVPGEDNKPQTVVVIRGTYEYPGEDGKPVFVTYVADENGYRAEGETIPKPARR